MSQFYANSLFPGGRIHFAGIQRESRRRLCFERMAPDDVLQQIAAENNLWETAFFIPQRQDFQLRWFTPVMEVDLCGHATLAPAFVLFTELGRQDETIRFHSRSGCLIATRRGEIVELDFPSRPPEPCAAPEELLRGLGRKPKQVLRSRDYFVLYESSPSLNCR